MISTMRYRFFKKDEEQDVSWKSERSEDLEREMEESETSEKSAPGDGGTLEFPDEELEFPEEQGPSEDTKICEPCKEEMELENPALDKFDMNGREIYLCEKCAREAGFID